MIILIFLQSTFSLPAKTCEWIIKKYPETIIRKAIKSTMKWKPNDFTYFKGALKAYTTQAKPQIIREIKPSTISPELLAKNKEHLNSLLSKP